MIRNITPLPLRSERAPFDHPDWIFELKYDGFRALAYIEKGRCRLVSRNGHSFSAFSELEKWIEASVPGNTVLDGEIAFFPLKYADHVERTGIALFERVCELDLEGILAKHKFAPYGATREDSTCVKIRNRNYSKCRAVRNYSSEIDTKSRFCAGTLVNWLAQKWKRMHEHRLNPNCEIEYAAPWSIKVYRAANTPLPSVPTAELRLVLIVVSDAAAIHSVVSVTTTTKYIPAFGNPFRLSAGLRSELPHKKVREFFEASPALHLDKSLLLG